MDKKIILGIMGLLVLIGATMVSGSPTGRPHYLVTNMDDNSSYWFTILVSANTSQCNDTDNGAKPFSIGTITAHTVNPVSHRMLTDYNGTGGKIREFVCGNDIYPSGIPFYTFTKAYLMEWDPNYQAP
ncbi:MAG: hypothetical protein FJY86_01370 [Candidatus Diapherotrites archaeon]|uniref:Uncharacterized protein n=1 Tax=Candidatus Iainarchaeum sp. TaxID=3101447 RepID=A0A8T4CA02_9ARCH|nr:hypothetical protein [Candidatus Diapherotrites archaeon]